MSRFAFVFPGQGSQAVGMGQALASASPAAAAVFAEADDARGQPISRLAWDGPAETLDRTENAQPALLATSIAYLAALRERGDGKDVQPAFAAGHSMGQYSAIVAAGVVSLGDGIRLVRERGRLMQASGQGREGAMAAILGLDDARLPELIAEASANGVFGVANRNAPGQVVVSGERRAVEAAAEIAKRLGARKIIVLPVSVAAIPRRSPIPCATPITTAASPSRASASSVPSATTRTPPGRTCSAACRGSARSRSSTCPAMSRRPPARSRASRPRSGWTRRPP